MSRFSRSGTATGGKGNINMFIERDPDICAAGLPNSKFESISHILPCYLLQDHVDALLHDTIKPSPQSVKLPYIKSTNQRDMRNAGIFCEAADLINPPVKTKFETLVDDFKNTLYGSYWKKEVGKVPDPKSSLPNGLNIYTTTMGKKYSKGPHAYDVIFPLYPISEQIPQSKRCGNQTNRNYCSFDVNRTFGMKTNADSSSRQVKSCLTDDRIKLGNNLKKTISTTQAMFTERVTAKLGITLDPNNNISNVPDGFAFGTANPPISIGVPECLTVCKINPDRLLLKKCLEHLNTLRKCMSKRFDGSFYSRFYLHFKYLDTRKIGWLPKDIIYESCKSNYIRFNPKLLEPLLSMWNIFDGLQIEYRAFVRVLNYREPTPELPKIRDISEDCLDFQTTYTEMVKENTEHVPNTMAGVPSGRYFDKDYPITPEGCCKADRIYLPQESDAKSCLCPSIFTLLGINHRDMFAKRDAKTIRQVFENSGEEFTDDSFNSIWNMAKRYHSQGWVCYESFRRSLKDYRENSPLK